MSYSVALEFPRDATPAQMESWLLGLHGLLSRGPFTQQRGVFEFDATKTGTAVSVWIEAPDLADAVADSFAASFPGGRAVSKEAANPSDLRHLARLTLGQSNAPLRSSLPVPGIGGSLSTLGTLRGNQRVVVQFSLVSAGNAEQFRLMERARRHESGHAASRDWSTMLLRAQSNRPRARAMREKAAAPLFETGVLVAASSGALLRDLTAGFARFASPFANVRRHRVFWAARARAQLASRKLPLWPPPARANVTELAAILGPTPEGLRAIRGPVARSRRLPAPPESSRGGLVICESNGERPRPVAVKRPDARLHTFLVGPTGTGKSTLIGNLVLAAAKRGDGVVLLDPKGDLVEDVLLRLPPEREADLVVIDPVRDRDYPVGLNLLEKTPGQDAAAVTDAIVAVMRDLYAKNWGARTDDTLYNGVFTAAARASTTLAELPRLYASAEFRRPFLAKLRDPFVRDFWSWFDGLSAPERGAIMAPVLNKLRPLLRPDLASIVGQRRSTVDLGDVLASRKVLLVRLPRDGALFGALLVARLWQAASRRAAFPMSKRPDVLLAVDEVHSFLRTGGDLGDMLAMARGLRLSLCAATQHLEQCPPPLRAALLANARTRVVFQADESDAGVLARGFQPELEAADLVGLGRYEVAVRMAVDGAVSRPFTGRTVPLPEPVRRSGGPLRELSRKRYGSPREEVEADLRERLGDAAGPDLLDAAQIGSRPR